MEEDIFEQCALRMLRLDQGMDVVVLIYVVIVGMLSQRRKVQTKDCVAQKVHEMTTTVVLPSSF